MSEPKKTITLRLPAALLAVIIEQARTEDRSVNAQIVRILRQVAEQGEEK